MHKIGVCILYKIVVARNNSRYRMLQSGINGAIFKCGHARRFYFSLFFLQQTTFFHKDR